MIANSFIFTINQNAFDADASAFIDYYSITDATQRNAINMFVKDLKTGRVNGSNTWNLAYNIYPMIGGDADKHKGNLKSVGVRELVFNGTLTHDANGVTGDGSTGYFYLNANPSDYVNMVNGWMPYFYSGSELPSSNLQSVMLGWDSTLSKVFGYINNTTLTNIHISDQTNTCPIGSRTAGFYIGGGKTGELFRGYKDTTEYLGSVNVPNEACDMKIGVLARQYNNGYDRFWGGNCRGYGDMQSLTAAQEADFYDAIQRFNTTLSRSI